MLGQYLVEAVDETRRPGRIMESLNTTYISLIPKIPKHISFSDFRLISLCLLIYKVILKNIARHIKPMLSRCITNEQFLFWRIDKSMMLLVWHKKPCIASNKGEKRL